MDFLPFPVWWDVLFFSFFVEGYQMDPPQLRMICIILRIRNPDQNLDFPLDSNSFQFAKWKPQKKNFGDQKPLRPPTQVNKSTPSPIPPSPKWWHKKWDASIRKIPIRSPLLESLVLERSLQIAPSEHRPSVSAGVRIPSLEPPGKKKRGSNGGLCRSDLRLFPCPLKGTKDVTEKTW